MTVPYKKTPFFRIPYLAKGAKLSETEEAKAANIIENQLLASTKGVKCSVFQDGDYRTIDNMDGTWTVVLSSTGENIALEGVINGGYCYSENPVIWENLQSGQIYYLYAAYTDNLYADETAFSPISRIHKVQPSIATYLLLATINTMGDTPVLDRYPDGKVYGTDITLHVTDHVNPHGEHLTQDTITLKENLYAEVETDSGTVTSPMLLANGNGHLNTAARRKILVAEPLTNGSEGVDIDVPNANTIYGAIAQERCWEGQGPTFLVGEIAIRVFEDKVRVYNSGEVGVPLTVTVFYLKTVS